MTAGRIKVLIGTVKRAIGRTETRAVPWPGSSSVTGEQSGPRGAERTAILVQGSGTTRGAERTTVVVLGLGTNASDLENPCANLSSRKRHS